MANAANSQAHLVNAAKALARNPVLYEERRRKYAGKSAHAYLGSDEQYTFNMATVIRNMSEKFKPVEEETNYATIPTITSEHTFGLNLTFGRGFRRASPVVTATNDDAMRFALTSPTGRQTIRRPNDFAEREAVKRAHEMRGRQIPNPTGASASVVPRSASQRTSMLAAPASASAASITARGSNILAELSRATRSQ